MIVIDLKMGCFDGDKWKLTYFGINKESQLINFPKSLVTPMSPNRSELTLVDIWENCAIRLGRSIRVNRRSL